MKLQLDSLLTEASPEFPELPVVSLTLPWYTLGGKNSVKNPDLLFLSPLTWPHSHPFALLPHYASFMFQGFFPPNQLHLFLLFLGVKTQVILI